MRASSQSQAASGPPASTAPPLRLRGIGEDHPQHRSRATGGDPDAGVTARGHQLRLDQPRFTGHLTRCLVGQERPQLCGLKGPQKEQPDAHGRERK